MGLFTKKDEHDDEDVMDIEVIGRSDVPDDLPSYEYELIGRDGKRMSDGLAGEEPSDEGGEGSEEDPEDTVADDPGSSPDDGLSGAQDDVPRASGDFGDDDAEPPADGEDPARFADRSVRAPIAVAALVVAVLIGGVLGFFVAGGGFGGSASGLTSLTEDQLSMPVASYTYNGAAHSVTAGDVIKAQYGTSAAKNDDGTYVMPSAEYVLAYVRNELLVAEAGARGITVSDDELASYCESAVGTSDYKALGDLYGITEEEAKETVRQSCMTNKLYEQVAGADAPAAPSAPEEGSEDAATPEYGAYVIGLLGDEWDAEKGTWARTDGPYYAALKDEQFSADAATYDQARTAYSVAYNAFYEKSSQAWSSFANDVFSRASVDLYGIVA